MGLGQPLSIELWDAGALVLLVLPSRRDWSSSPHLLQLSPYCPTTSPTASCRPQNPSPCHAEPSHPYLGIIAWVGCPRTHLKHCAAVITHPGATRKPPQNPPSLPRR